MKHMTIPIIDDDHDDAWFDRHPGRIARARKATPAERRLLDSSKAAVAVVVRLAHPPGKRATAVFHPRGATVPRFLECLREVQAGCGEQHLDDVLCEMFEAIATPSPAGFVSLRELGERALLRNAATGGVA
jgi:hypothetical protein